jgi:hypothetical protein
MSKLKSLIKNKTTVWIFCRNECLQEDLLQQAEHEGFMTINGHNPSTLNHRQLYGINKDMQIGCISVIVWVQSAKPCNRKGTPARIDYEKYLAGENDYSYYGHFDDVPDRHLWKKIAYEYTNKDDFFCLCNIFIEGQSYKDYTAYIYRWLIESAWHYSPESAFTKVLENINIIARSYAEKITVSDCAFKVGYDTV